MWHLEDTVKGRKERGKIAQAWLSGEKIQGTTSFVFCKTIPYTLLILFHLILLHATIHQLLWNRSLTVSSGVGNVWIHRDTWNQTTLVLGLFPLSWRVVSLMMMEGRWRNISWYHQGCSKILWGYQPKQCNKHSSHMFRFFVLFHYYSWCCRCNLFY